MNLWRRHWTRHSLILIGAGLIYIGIGIGFHAAPPIVAKDPSLVVALHWLSMHAWGWVYIAAGTIALSASLWPSKNKVWGYMVLTGLSSAWACFYALAIVFHHAPSLVWISVLLWSVLAFNWWAVSGLISPEHIEELMSRQGFFDGEDLDAPR